MHLFTRTHALTLAAFWKIAYLWEDLCFWKIFSSSWIHVWTTSSKKIISSAYCLTPLRRTYGSVFVIIVVVIVFVVVVVVVVAAIVFLLLFLIVIVGPCNLCYRQGRALKVKVGDKELDVENGFRMFVR